MKNSITPSRPCIQHYYGNCECFAADDHHKGMPIYYYPSKLKCEEWPNAVYEEDEEDEEDEAAWRTEEPA